MMEKQKLRQADFITGILLLVFGGWVISQALKMPMDGTYGGVQNTWYTSPALFPLIIGFFFCVLSIVLVVNAIKCGALEGIKKDLAQVKLKPSMKTMRVVIVVFYFAVMIYLYISRTDFFLNVVFFLGIFISSFYFDKDEITKKIALFYLISAAIFFLITVTGLAGLLNGLFSYSTDVLILINIVIMFIYIRKVIAGYPDELDELRKKYRMMFFMSILVPLILCPVFRYSLRVPLPHEGGIIQLFNMIYYSLR